MRPKRKKCEFISFGWNWKITNFISLVIIFDAPWRLNHFWRRYFSIILFLSIKIVWLGEKYRHRYFCNFTDTHYVVNKILLEKTRNFEGFSKHCLHWMSLVVKIHQLISYLTILFSNKQGKSPIIRIID